MSAVVTGFVAGLKGARGRLPGHSRGARAVPRLRRPRAMFTLFLLRIYDTTDLFPDTTLRR